MMKSKILIVVATAMSAAVSLATGIEVDPYDTQVTPGVWCGNFHSATNYAVTHDMPLVMFWGADGCHYCEELSEALGAADGLSWAATKNAVFCKVEGNGFPEGDNEPNIGACEFAGKGVLSGWPYIRLWWPQRHSVRFMGRPGEMYVTTGDTLLEQFANSYDQFISEVDFSVSYASFPMGDAPCDRLEAIVGETSFVDVPLVRTNATEKTASCKLRFTAGGVPSETAVSWSVGETCQFVRYQLPAGIVAGAQIGIALVDGSSTVVAERHIWCLDEVENSPKNPYWLGEKTTDSLAWGEWSMDLDVVTNKVNAWNAAHPGDRAYAMMFVGGSTWCPDCAMAEANFFSKQSFKDWAVAHKVVFGVLDIPNNPQVENAYPSQLRYESNRTSDAFVTLRNTAPTNELERWQSGAGYLSRHSVAYDDALAVAKRNAFLMGHNTLNGGWNRPERANKNRTGVPVLILLRDDGTIAARWNRFSDVGPSAYYDGYLRRFEEMMAQIDDPNEESDDDTTTTTRTIATGEQVSSTVSSVDQADVFFISDAVRNKVVSYHVTGDAGSLKASIVDALTGAELSAVTNVAAAGLTVSAKLADSDYVLRIAPPKVADGQYFGYTNDVSTVCAYSVSASSFMSGGVIGFSTTSTNVMESCGTVTLTVCRKDGNEGAASVKVHLAASEGEGVAERVTWTDTVLSWSHGEGGDKTAVLTISDDVVVRHDMRLTFTLTDLTGDAQDLSTGTSSMVVNVYDDEIFGVPVYRYVEFSDARPIEGYQPGDEVVVVLKSGEIPEGVEVSAVGGSLIVSGCTFGSAGTYGAVYTVSRIRGGDVVGSEDVVLEFTVTDYDFAGDIPSLATTRTYDNLPLLDEAEEMTLVAGLLTVTVPADGLLSAKFMTQGKTYAYASLGWKSFDRSAGLISAELAATDGSDRTMTVTLVAGGGEVSFDNPTDGQRLEFALPAKIWPEGAGIYRGQYAVQMPQTNIVDGAGATMRAGAGYMALRMNSESAVACGSMLYAGVLPNGRAFYASRTLLPPSAEGSGAARLPFYHYSDMKTSGYVFSGGVDIAPNAVTRYDTLRWCVTKGWDIVWATTDAADHQSEFGVYGGYYDSTRITEHYNEDFAGKLDNFAFQVRSELVDSARYGLGTAFPPVQAEMTSENQPQISELASNPYDLVMRFSTETGVLSGSFRLPFAGGREVALTFRAIALPGWQGCDACAAKGFVERPWAVGSCAFSDRGATGIYQNGCEVRLHQYK